MLATQGKEANKSTYSNVYEDADPYLEWYEHLAVLKYTVHEKGNNLRRHITVPFSRIYSFNWDWKQPAEQDAAANP